MELTHLWTVTAHYSYGWFKIIYFKIYKDPLSIFGALTLKMRKSFWVISSFMNLNFSTNDFSLNGSDKWPGIRNKQYPLKTIPLKLYYFLLKFR